MLKPGLAARRTGLLMIGATIVKLGTTTRYTETTPITIQFIETQITTGILAITETVAITITDLFGIARATKLQPQRVLVAAH